MLNINQRRFSTDWEIKKLSRDLLESSPGRFKGIPHDKFLESFRKISENKKYTNVNMFTWDGHFNFCIYFDYGGKLGKKVSEYQPRICITSINTTNKSLNIYAGAMKGEFGAIVPFKTTLRRTTKLKTFEFELINGLSETEILLDYQLEPIINKLKVKQITDPVLHYCLLNAGASKTINWNQVGRLFTKTQKKASLNLEALLLMQSNEVRVRANRPRYQLESMYRFYNLLIRS